VGTYYCRAGTDGRDARNATSLDEFEYDNGCNNFGGRHTFNVRMLYSISFARGRKHGSDAGNIFTNAAAGGNDLEFRMEVFNVFDNINYSSPMGTLPQAIPTAALSEENRVQPGQPYWAAAAGTFGRTVGLGTRGRCNSRCDSRSRTSVPANGRAAPPARSRLRARWLLACCDILWACASA
jgi:hypothetical protein